LKKATAALLEVAAGLARKRGTALSLVLFGRRLEPHLDLFRGGPADRIVCMDHPRLEHYLQETYTGALAKLVFEERPEILLFLSNECGRELAPRLAARLGTGLCADCIRLGIDPETGLLVQTVAAFGDRIYGKILTPEKRPQMATVRPDVILDDGGEPSVERRGAPEIRRIPFPDREVRERVKRVGAEKDPDMDRSLERARIVVCGGRGMGSEGRFQALWELARLVGGEVGATRPPVHAHWVGEERMIGQTGRTIAPEVLLAFGISGAVQFTAAIRQSRYVVGINRDPKASIFSCADLGIVGDVKQILPELLRRLRRLLVEQYGRSPEEVDPEGAGKRAGGLGKRLRDLREERGYEVAEAAAALEVTSEDVEAIEGNRAAPSVSLLLRLAQLYRVDPAPFLTLAEGDRADRRRVESYTKRTQNYSYRTLTPGAEQKHLRAFRITIDPRRDHKMIEYKHEGEEFVYVLRGEVEIKVGEEVHALKRGESLHFEASIPHHLRNPSPQKTELIVVLYTP
jgi:electron transfer flavoprotein alpha subunit/quercetin dioxygenase-like cupin family protein